MQLSNTAASVATFATSAST